MPAALTLLGGAGLLASIACLYSGVEWIRPYFYIPAWWSMLALLVGLNRRGESERGRLARMALLSVPFWLGYELLNLRLENWEYHDLPNQIPLRWVGYALAFATVLPAVLETAAFLKARWPVGESLAPRPWLSSPSCARLSTALGLACLALPLWEPRYFFPLVWAPFFLLCEPVLARRRPRDSWLAALAEGNTRPIAALLTAGLLCGLAWEALNFWSGAKWRYTVPWPSGPKLFEMPWLGYLGFPPFALGCASAWQAHELWWEEAELGAKLCWVVSLLVISLLIFAGIDAQTLIRAVHDTIP